MIEKIGDWWLPQHEQHLRPYLAEHREYQKRNRQWAMRGLAPGGYAIDVGAHVGLWLRDLCDHFDHVWAWEPRDLHQQCLKLNVTKENYTLIPHMAGDHEHRAGLVIDPENSGHTHRKPEGDILVECIDSRTWPRGLRLIKIDVEGDELAVIRGAEMLIQVQHPRICLEQKPHPLAEQEGQYAARDLLIKWGYVPLQHHGDDWVMEWRG